MAELNPYPFAPLATRMFRELGEVGAIFELPATRFFRGEDGLDLSVSFHQHTASTALGPAAGPHTQMAQNIVLSWLAGCRIFELKTVQINDELNIGRPCIDMATVGYNIEWSQELRIPQSVEEYVKASMLIEMLRHSGALGFDTADDRVVFDMSVGYDLAGIQSAKVRAFIEGLLDASEVVERLRAQIPAELAHLRAIDFSTRLSDSLTLSTFHGCPPDEIEAIVDWLMRTYDLRCVVKLNPTLLGREDGRRILNAQLGYEECVIPDSAFAEDTTWDQMVAFMGRLGDTAAGLGLSLGAKLSNTQIVENHRDFFPPSEAVMYLSGQPLHVLAMELVRRFRATFGDRLPISFSAGIDRQNFADAVALGLTPITVCSDLLRPGGYGRAPLYLRNLGRRMREVGARDIDEWVIRAYGLEREALAAAEPTGDEGPRCLEALDAGIPLADAAGPELLGRWRTEALMLGTEHYVAGLHGEARYTAAKNSRAPKKIDSDLELLDCIACDKCLPVCPNVANFAYRLPLGEIPVVELTWTGSAWKRRDRDSLKVEQEAQIGNFVDFCNDCGNCDVFCPELGGPYKLKPRFHSSARLWAEEADRDGFFVSEALVLGRFGGREFRSEWAGDRVSYSGEGFDVSFEADAPEATFEGSADVPVDLTYHRLMALLREGLLYGREPNFIRYLGAATS